MSTIEDWINDYTGADTNDPADAANITTTLDDTIRDLKANIRTESLRKGFEADAYDASRISNFVIQIDGVDLRDTYHPGMAVKVLDGAAIKGGFIASMTLSGSDTRLTLYDVRTDKGAATTLTASVTKAWFSVYTVRGEQSAMATHSYPDLPLLLPRRFQSATITIGGTAVTGGTYLAFPEPNTQYYVAAQVVGTNGDVNDGSLYVRRVTKSTTTVSIRLYDDPGSGTSVTWQIVVYRQQGGFFI